MSTSTSKPLKPKRGTTAQNNAYTGEAYEVTLDTDKKTLVVHDGLTAGGFPLARADEVVAKDAQQDAAITAAQSSADEKVSALDGTLRGLIEAEKSALEGQIQAAVPAGTVIAFASNNALDGFLLCNGAAVSRTTYAKLFEAIGTTYGTGNGSSTFNLPNLTDKFIQGGGTAGTVKAAGLPNIHGNVAYITGTEGVNAFYAPSGAISTFVDSTAVQRRLFPATGSSVHGGPHLEVNASKSNSIYGASTTVQPPALTMRCYIKY